MNFFHKFKKYIFTPIKFSFVIAIIFHFFLLTSLPEEILLAVPVEKEEKITFRMVNKKEMNSNRPEEKFIVEEMVTEETPVEEKKEIEEKEPAKEDKEKEMAKEKTGEEQRDENSAKQKIEEICSGSKVKIEQEEGIVKKSAATEKQNNKIERIKPEQEKEEKTEEIEEEKEIKPKREKIISETKFLETEEKETKEDKIVVTKDIEEKDNKVKENNKKMDKQEQKTDTEFNPVIRQMQARYEYRQCGQFSGEFSTEDIKSDINNRNKEKKEIKESSQKPVFDNLDGKQEKISNKKEEIGGEEAKNLTVNNNKASHDKQNDGKQVEVIDFTQKEIPGGPSPPGAYKLEQPVYPQNLRKRGIEGSVILKLLLSEKGEVEEIEIYRSSGFKQFDSEAKNAAKKWEFTAAKRENKNVKAWILAPVKFILD